MKTPLLSILLISVALCGCSAYRNAWRTNGELQVSVHAPEDMIGKPVTYYVDGKAVSTTTNLTQSMSLLPKKNSIKVEMAGTKPFEQIVTIPGNGSKQVLDVTLAKE